MLAMFSHLSLHNASSGFLLTRSVSRLKELLCQGLSNLPSSSGGSSRNGLNWKRPARRSGQVGANGYEEAVQVPVQIRIIIGKGACITSLGMTSV